MADTKERIVKNWADDDDEDDDHHYEEEDSNGLRERVKFTTNNKGQKIKTTTKVRVHTLRSKTPKRVEARKNLPRFGNAHIGEENVTLPSRDWIALEHPDDQLIEDVDDPSLAKTLANFIIKRQETKARLDMEGNDVNEPNSDTNEPQQSGTDGKYVPPGGRTGASGSSLAALADNNQSESTIRVSNLTKNVTEDDLHDLFSHFGRIHRVALPGIVGKDGKKETRGFAYIAYVERKDAEKAMEGLQGYGYDHLIIKLEWAKPTSGGGKDNGGGNGLSSGYVTGYGKQLAQDSKEKFHTFSQVGVGR
jgi:translation initiation factor 3 subunit G